MNCQSCRQHVQPFLDDELSVKDNVAVLEHVTACAPCQEVFAAERRIWDAVRGELTKDACPAACAERALAAVRSEAGGPWWKRWPVFAAPIAAALILVALLRLVADDAPRGPHGGDSERVRGAGVRVTFAADRSHDHTMHGDLLGWAGARYDELVDGLPKGHVLTAANMATAADRAMLPLEEFEQAVKTELGADFKLPPGFLDGGRVVGGELLSWHDGWVPQVVIEFGDRELVLYEISSCTARKLGCDVMKLMASLHPVESDQGRQVSIASCKGCDAILVLRNNRAYILISRHGRDWNDAWMLDRARRLLD